MKDGVSCRDVYQHAVDFVKGKSPDLEKAFVKNLGFSVSLRMLFQSHLLSAPQTGIEFRDAAYILSSKSTRTLRSKMIVNLSLGFSGLTDKSGQK